LLAQLDEARAYVADCWTVVFPEVRDRLEVWAESAGQPDQLKVPLRLAFQVDHAHWIVVSDEVVH
jgi:hypothetical protein